MPPVAVEINYTLRDAPESYKVDCRPEKVVLRREKKLI